MIGKIIGAAAGAQASKYARNIDGTTGAVIGAVAVPIVRRMKILPLLAIGAAGYGIKRLADRGAEIKKQDTQASA